MVEVARLTALLSNQERRHRQEMNRNRMKIIRMRKRMEAEKKRAGSFYLMSMKLRGELAVSLLVSDTECLRVELPAHLDDEAEVRLR